MIKKLASILFLLPHLCFADSPSRQAFDYRVCSSKNTYCALVSRAGNITVIKNGDTKGGKQLAFIAGWYPQVFISNDGRKIVTVGTTIVPARNFDQPVVKFFIEGKQSKELFVKQLALGHKIRETTSGFHWGDPVDFTENESAFSFELDDGAVVQFSLQH